jgi:hypothetical protein
MDEVREQILAMLMEGLSLATICQKAGMPSARTVQRWQADDEEFAVAVTHAREHGFQLLADRARLNAQTAEDAAKGRLAFDADRWYLGKLSNAFSDNKEQKHNHSGQIGLKVIEIQFGRGPKAGE